MVNIYKNTHTPTSSILNTRLILLSLGNVTHYFFLFSSSLIVFALHTPCSTIYVIFKASRQFTRDKHNSAENHNYQKYQPTLQQTQTHKSKMVVNIYFINYLNIIGSHGCRTHTHTQVYRI